MQSVRFPFFHTWDVPAAQNRFRWKSKKSAGNLKNPLDDGVGEKRSHFGDESKAMPVVAQ
jgi:hypothetical protein